MVRKKYAAGRAAGIAILSLGIFFSGCGVQSTEQSSALESNSGVQEEQSQEGQSQEGQTREEQNQEEQAQEEQIQTEQIPPEEGYYRGTDGGTGAAELSAIRQEELSVAVKFRPEGQESGAYSIAVFQWKEEQGTYVQTDSRPEAAYDLRTEKQGDGLQVTLAEAGGEEILAQTVYKDAGENVTNVILAVKRYFEEAEHSAVDTAKEYTFPVHGLEGGMSTEMYAVPVYEKGAGRETPVYFVLVSGGESVEQGTAGIYPAETANAYFNGEISWEEMEPLERFQVSDYGVALVSETS